MRRAFRGATPGISAAVIAMLAPGGALAHAGERMVILTLPTGRYIAGAAAAVALTAVVGVLAPRLPDLRPRRLFEHHEVVPAAVTSWLGWLMLVGLLATGFWGSRDPLANPLTLAFWTVLWVGLSLATILLGDLWRPVNPWTGPVRSVRRALGLTGSAGLSRLGVWPAVLGYLGLAWFEIVSLAPADPAVLARTLLGYWLLVFGLAVLEGEAWIGRGEALTVYFGFIARIAPLWRERAGGRVRWMAGPPGAQILAMPALGPGEAAFVTLVLASVSFDGLADTFWWLGRIGVNPLEFPGRSAVTLQNTLGLLGAWLMTAGLILGAVALGRRLAGRRMPFWPEAGPWLLSFLPIAAGYHAAHYLVALLTGGQYAIAALNDPLGRGWSLLGLPHHWVSFAFLNDRDAVTAIWNAQFGLILGAHVLAVLLAVRLAGRDGPASRLLHLPMTGLMVLYTVFGLWLLSTATAA
jgi:hypothetical protein